MQKTLHVAGLLAIISAAAFAVLASTTPRQVQHADPVETPGIPWTGSVGISETVAQIMERQAHHPLLPLPAAKSTENERRPERFRRPNPDSPSIARWPQPASESFTAPEPMEFASIGAHFLAVSYGQSGEIPPDTIGAVGPSQILVVVNGRVRVFDRSGQLGALDTSLDTFFGAVNRGLHTWDPQVKYDRLSGRFFLTALTNGLPNYVVIAASSGGTITSSTSFTFFAFRQDEPLPAGHADGWADFDGLGVDRHSLYIGIDVGSAFPDVQFLATDGFVVNKADLLSGTLTVTAFRDLYPGGNHSGPDDPRGVSNDDPNAAEGYFIGPDVKFFGRLTLRRITYPGGIPAVSGNIFLTVPQTTLPMRVPHAGMLNDPLDVEDDRLFVATIFTDKLTGETSLWSAQNLQVDGTGVASDTGGRDGARWYQIGNLSGAPALLQSGTLYDSAPIDPRSFFIPSMGMSGQGYALLGFSTAGSIFHIDAGVAGRLSGDPPGTTGPFTRLTDSSTVYTPWASANIEQWGDYSETQVDPNDDMTFWTFQEYCDVDNSWGVWVAELKAPPPAAPVSVTPSSLCPGLPSAEVTVSGSVISGSGFFDPGPDTGGPGFANHIAASVTGGVVVNQVLFDSPAQLRLTLSTVEASSGAQDITVTNPDGQSMTGSGILTLAPRPAAPAAGNNGPVCQGGMLQLTASTVPGAAYLWTGPGGFTSTLQNPTIPGAMPAQSGTYQVALTVACGCAPPPASTFATVVADQAPCSDGKACTLGESCQGGICQGGIPPDADGDQHVDGACGGDDCNDANPLVWQVPVEVTNLMLTTASPADPTWDSQGALAGPETTYDLVSGSLGPESGILFSAGSCLQSAGPASYADTRPDPPTGESFWYLSRATNGCGTGTYGSASRDSSIPSCP